MVMKQKLIYILIFFFISTANGFSETSYERNSLMLGVQAGGKGVHGYYGKHLENAFHAGIYGIYPFTFLNRYLLGELNLTYTSYALANSKTSEIESANLSIGQMFYYPVFKYLHPCVDMKMGVNYLYLTTEKTNVSKTTFKPAFSAGAGFFIPVIDTIKIRVTTEYTVFELSNELFMETTIGAGLSYVFKFYDEEEITKIRKTLEHDEQYDRALELFRNGDGMKARKIFKKISDYNDDFKDSRNYLEIINNNEKKYKEALELLEEKKYIEALPVLMETEKYFIEAREKLAETRKILSKELKKMEERAITAYDKKEYEECIVILKKIQQIDPDNKTFNLYYPKAVKRYRAIKIFE